MFFSDDVSAVSYVVALLLLGELPWENCKSEEAILKRKQSTTLEEKLKEYPELLDFVTMFRSRNTDEIDYAKWIKLFRTAAQRSSPDGTDTDCLPFLSGTSRMETKRKRVSQTAKKETVPRKSNVQEIINDSPLSAKRRFSLKRPSEAPKKEVSLKRSHSKQSEKKTQPTRIQPKRACKRSYFSPVFVKNRCHHYHATANKQPNTQSSYYPARYHYSSSPLLSQILHPTP